MATPCGFVEPAPEKTQRGLQDRPQDAICSRCYMIVVHLVLLPDFVISIFVPSHRPSSVSDTQPLSRHLCQGGAFMQGKAMASRLEAFAIRLEAMASRLEAIAIRLEVAWS